MRLEESVLVVDERHSTGHTGGEIVADTSKDRDRSAGHVFATIRAATLDDCGDARVADSKAFSRLSSRKEPTRGSAVQNRVTDDGVVVRGKSGRRCRPQRDGGPG